MLFRVYVGAVYFARYTWQYKAMFIWLKFTIMPQTVGQSSPSTNAFRLFNQDFALSFKILIIICCGLLCGRRKVKLNAG